MSDYTKLDSEIPADVVQLIPIDKECREAIMELSEALAVPRAFVIRMGLLAISSRLHPGLLLPGQRMPKGCFWERRGD